MTLSRQQMIAAEVAYAKTLGHAPITDINELWVVEGEGMTPLPRWARNPGAAFELQVQYGITLETARSDGLVVAKVPNGQYLRSGKHKFFKSELAIADYNIIKPRCEYDWLPSELRAAMHLIVLVATMKREQLNRAAIPLTAAESANMGVMTPQVLKTHVRGVDIT